MGTESFWAGAFGDEYTTRCRVEWEKRVPFWKSAIDYCTPTSVLEVGCNAGWNLRALQSIDSSIEVCGVDVNANAVNEARAAGVEAEVGRATAIAALFGRASKDLVFTAGVLIHVAPDDLDQVLQAIIDTSARYVLAIEYEAEKEEPVEYRGHADRLWKRDYGALYINKGMKLLALGNAEGFDDCTFWLFEKPGMPT